MVSAYVGNVAAAEYRTLTEATGTNTQLVAALGAPRTYGLVVRAGF